MVVLLARLAPDAYTQHRLRDDDTLLFTIEQHVTVTATRLPVEFSYAPAATESYDEAALALLPGSSIADILSLSAGATLRDYGGPGSLQLASLRGVGAEYTLVYLDGIRLNDSQNATVDLGRLSLRQVERVEIARGGFASLYGTNALGGVINILSQRETPPPSVQIGAGSFGWHLASISAGLQGRAGRVFIDAGYEEADNDFSFAPSWGGPKLTRENASFYRASVKTGGSLHLGTSILTLFADASDSQVGAPGPLFSSAQGSASQDDRQLLVSTRFRASAGAGILTLGAGARLSTQRYRDPSLSFNGQPLDSRYDNSHITLTSSWEVPLFDALRLGVGAEVSEDNLRSEDIQGKPSRRQIAGYATGDLALQPAGMVVHIFPSLRFDGIIDQADGRDWNIFSPSLGLHIQLLPEILSVRGRISRNFCAPTFNQMYWREGGNPNLRTEKSTAIDGGFTIQSKTWLENADVTYFHHDITDKILWMPGQGIWWSPRNIQHVVSNGVESSIGLAFFAERLRLRLAGQWIDATRRNASFAGDATQFKQLIYVPKFSGSITCTAALTDAISLAVTQRIIGKRYYTETNDAALPGVFVTDLSAQSRILVGETSGTLKLEMFNVFDVNYEVIAFYPMPGRSVRGILITEF